MEENLNGHDRMKHSILFNYDDLEDKLSKYESQEELKNDLIRLDHKICHPFNAIFTYYKKQKKSDILDAMQKYDENLRIILKPGINDINELIEDKQKAGDLENIDILIKIRDERIKKRQKAPKIMYGSLRSFVRMLKEDYNADKYPAYLEGDFFRFVTFWNSHLGMREDDSLGCIVIQDWTKRTREFEDQGIRYFLDFGKNIKTDVDYFSVIDNLLGNALKYAFNGQKEKQVKMVVEKDDAHQYYLISVSDNGVGIPEGLKDKIFEKGYTTGNSNGHGTGSGIGLSECRDIVVKAGGSIEVKSELGKGTTFYFTIPYEVCK